jgi:hypothetical protein
MKPPPPCPPQIEEKLQQYLNFYSTILDTIMLSMSTVEHVEVSQQANTI